MELIVPVFLYILLPICILLLLVKQNKRKFKTYRQPPGPRGFPILGNVLGLRFDRLDLSLYPLAERYGKIFQINILGRNLVVLNDVRTTRKAFLNEEFSKVFCDRADNFTGKYIWFDNHDVLFGKACKRTWTLRKILTNCIQGLIREKDRSHDEMHELIEELKASNGSDVDIVRCLRRGTGKWIASLVTGKVANDADSKAIWDFIDASEHTFNAGLGMLLQAFPFIRYLPGKPGQIFRSAVETRDKLLKRLFNTNMAEESAEKPGLLREIIQRKERENNKAGYHIVDDLRGLGVDIYFGGVDTTVTALKHIFALLLSYPDHAKAIQTEIDTVIGRSREPSINDKARMPFLTAFILESQRFTTQAPLGVPYRTTEDIIFEGYSIPKHTTVLVNFWFVHHDEKIWRDPWNFRPARLLDSNGKLLPQDHPLMQALMPFGIGPRTCPGQVLGMNRLFMFVACILQCFNIYPTVTGSMPEIDPRLNKIRISPEIGDYHCRFELRT